MKRIFRFFALILLLLPVICACQLSAPSLNFDGIMNNPSQDNEQQEGKPEENNPTTPNPGVDNPNENEPVDPNPGDDNPSGNEPVDPNPGDDNPSGNEPVDPNPGDDNPSGNEPVDPNPGDDNPNGNEPVDPNPGDDNPSENEPIGPIEGKELQVIAIEMRGTYGDSYLIKYGDFEILVDAGTTSDKEYVQAALNEFVTDKELDILMLSHLHADHIGSMTNTSFFYNLGVSVKTIVDPGTTPSTDTAENYVLMRKSLINKGSKYYTYYDIINSDSIETVWYIDQLNDLYLEFFDTGSISKPNTKPSDMNSSSIAFALNYMNNKWFFAGDLPTSSEKTLVQNIKKIDSNYYKESDYVVFKACHHGSAGSNSDELLSFVKPDVVFIMAGIVSKNQGNQSISSQHPYLAAVKRMKKFTDKIYWSSINGLSIFKSKGNEVTFDARGRTVDYYYNGKIVSREEERYVTLLDSKWYLMMK